MELPPLAVDENMPILKKNRLSTGISDLDIILEGGYHNPSLVLIIGPSGMEKSALAFHFAASGLSNKKEHVLFITADATTSGLEDKINSIGLSLKSDNISFIDCYSATLGTPSTSESQTVFVSGPGALEDLSVAIKDVLDKNAGKKIRVIFYSLSTMMLYNPKESLLRFLQLVSGRMRNAGCTALLLVEEGIHEKQFLSMVEHSVDDKIIISDKGNGFELDLANPRITVPFKLGSEGISIL